MSRETHLAAAFTELTEAMVTGRDVGAFLHLLCCHSVELLDVEAAGVMLADEQGELRTVGASDERAELMEVFALQHQEGPCLDVYEAGKAEQTSVTATLDRWPRFGRLAVEHGYGWICGLPLRHGLETIGALNLFRRDDEPLAEEHVRLAQALADVATAGLLQQRQTTAARQLARQLQTALDSRRLIEQAKGILAERFGIGPELAFEHLRRQARNGNRKIHDVAGEIVGQADSAN